MSPKKSLLSTTRSKIIFCIGGLLFSAMVLLVSADVSLAGLFPSENTLENARREQKKAAAAFEEAEAKQKEFAAVSAKFKELTGECWVESRDGLPDIELRRKIETAARTAELEQVNIGAARRSRLNNDLYFLEVEVNTAAPLDLLTVFWRELGKVKPPLGWKRVDLRPEQSQNSERIFFSGTLRLLGRETVQEEAAKGEKQGARQ